MAANRILLYIHGILGDTLGMTTACWSEVTAENAPVQRIVNRYDLVLAFDYENINTKIEETARVLKERLAAVGLRSGHGKILHIAAHSMGGLVARWFIEREGGNQIVQHLVTLGTPHAGSPWPTIQDWATTALGIGLNALGQVSWTAKILGELAGVIEAGDVTLDQMAPNSAFLAELAVSPDPKTPYTLLVGNTSIIPGALDDDRLGRLLAKLAPQRVLHATASLAFLKNPNDIAVAVTSAQAAPKERVFAPLITEVACDHVTFFSSDAGRQALLGALPEA